jgi:hypothetical protein
MPVHCNLRPSIPICLTAKHYSDWPSKPEFSTQENSKGEGREVLGDFVEQLIDLDKNVVEVIERTAEAYGKAFSSSVANVWGSFSES